jgi:hypothetical protein
MTKEDALIIRTWREKGCTWRRIADYASERWPEKEYEPGNQEQGAHLCDVACSQLGEKPNEKPWN